MNTAIAVISTLLAHLLVTVVQSAPADNVRNIVQDEIEKINQYYQNNPNTAWDRACFAKITSGSLEFAIDVAANPSADQVDTQWAENPESRGENLIGTTGAYRMYIESFINLVTRDLKPEQTAAVIYDNGAKFYLKGRALNASADSAGPLVDAAHNLRAMFPKITAGTPNRHVGVNNALGLLVGAALTARQAGVPVVMNDKNDTNAAHRIIVSDGASGLKWSDMTDDPSKTTVIDIGNRRFTSKLSNAEVLSFMNVQSLDYPQQLDTIVTTIRFLVCIVSTR